MVIIDGVSISFGGKCLLSGVSWRVGDRDRVGLVGANGSGKTTILRMIMGKVTPDSGTVTASRRTTFGYLPQEQMTLAGRTLFDEVASVFERVMAIESRMRELEHEMHGLPHDAPDYDRVMREYARLQHEFDAADGFTAETRVAEVLAGLGFSQGDHQRATEEFSGGWQMRIALAKLLLARPNVLLLDEPTNHLDLESIIWLEEYLRDYPGAVVLVSHDRSFLDRVVSRITELGVEGLVDYRGGYSSFLAQREKRKDTLLATRKQQERQIAHHQRFVDRWSGYEAKVRMRRSRIKMIERLKSELVSVPRGRKGIHFEFPQPERGGAVSVALKNATQAYGENVVFEHLDLEILRGDRIAIVGLNGAGKSTLLKVLAGRLQLSEGERKLGNNVTIQYFAQDPGKSLNASNTVLGELESVSPDAMRPKLRNLLGAFLFVGDDVEKKVSVLSGGEKSRLAFAKMLLRPANVLLLDEPTNHLDVSAREVLERALSEYEGTICFVSHDRAFMNAIATSVLEVDDGNFRTYLGSYKDYVWAKERERAEAAEPVPAQNGAAEGEGRAKRTGGGPKTKEQKRKEAEARSRRSKGKRPRRDERRAVLDEIAAAERRLEEIAIALVDPSVYKDGERAKTLVTEQRELTSSVDALYLRWAELED